MSWILIADDDAATREFLSFALTDEGYEVHTVPNGAAALCAVAEHQPALILLDTRMPIMDGAAFVQAYHQRRGLHAPIIVLSADEHAIGTDCIRILPSRSTSPNSSISSASTRAPNGALTQRVVSHLIL